MSDVGWSPFDAFAEGGFPMYVIACIGGLAHLMAIAALASMMASRRAMPLGMGAATLLFAISTMCIGVGGYAWGMRQVDIALAFVEDPSMRDALRAQGQAEASNNLYFGGCAFLFPLLAGAIAIGRGAMMKDGPPAA